MRIVSRHNRKCTLFALFWVLVAPVGLAVAWLFFRYVPQWALGRFGVEMSDGMAIFQAVLCILALFWSGWNVWQNQTNTLDALVAWEDRGISHVSGGAVAVDFYSSQVSGLALFLSQIFFLGPHGFFRAMQWWRRRVQASDEEEKSLVAKLEELKRVMKWQGLDDHRGDEALIIRLAQMGLIDFSIVPKMRFKARNENDTVL